MPPIGKKWLETLNYSPITLKFYGSSPMDFTIFTALVPSQTFGHGNIFDLDSSRYMWSITLSPGTSMPNVISVPIPFGNFPDAKIGKRFDVFTAILPLQESGDIIDLSLAYASDWDEDVYERIAGIAAGSGGEEE